MIRAALDKTLALLPPSWATAIDLNLRPEIRWRWGGPMNGQDGRMAMVRALLTSAQIEQVLETGTSRGATTEWFAKVFGGPVLSVDYNRRNYLFSKAVLREHPNAVVFEMDSREWLGRLAADPEVNTKRTLFYLDAHDTGKSQPVTEEIKIIANGWRDYVIVIDDVALPDDDGYDGENLGNGLKLDLAYVMAGLPDHLKVYLPALPSSRESGMRRGCVVLAPTGPLADNVGMVDHLRSA